MKQKVKKLEHPKYDTFGFHLFAGVVIAAVIAVVVSGLLLAGSPAEERAHRIDMGRISSLQSIAAAIDRYYDLNNALPADLEALTKARETYYIEGITDPETGLPYEYVVRGTNVYDLCASFTTNSFDQSPTHIEPYERWESRFWEHEAGRTCFNITAQSFPK